MKGGPKKWDNFILYLSLKAPVDLYDDTNQKN